MKSVRVFCVLCGLLFSAQSFAGIELTRLFADGMVLQRAQPVRVWGWATPGQSIRVTFDGRSISSVAAPSGRWEAMLPAHAAGGPFLLSVEGDATAIVLHDVLVGEVWICSGQSNMELTVSQANDPAATMAAATDPLIRQFKVPKSWSDTPDDRLAGGAWVAASPQTVGAFTAAGYFFARELRARLGVPVGLINTTWGGSSIEAWTDAATQGVDAEAFKAKMRGRDADDQRRLDEVRARIVDWQAPRRGLVDGRAVWADPQLDDTAWAEIPMSRRWEESGYEGMDGFAWYRTTFELSAEDAAKGIVLGLGPIDDSDQTWVNGQLVGGMQVAWNKPRVYQVNSEALRAGRNTIAVRVEDLGGGGGIYGDPQLRFVRTADGVSHPLADAWKFKPDDVRLNLDDDKNQIATLLYNKMIHPLQPYTIKGVIWYQGEANATPASAYPYRQQFARMIGSWRQQWQEGDFPFLWVQIANFASGGDTPEYSPWATLRDSQSAALALRNTAQAVIIDIGNPADIHPRNKQEVGRRLALAARHLAYGEKLVYSGPTYKAMRVTGAKVELSFEHRGARLMARDRASPLQGFTIAGVDRGFVPAQAVVVGDHVLVWNEGVKHPTAVAYAWSDNPEAANLVNAEGLPASPFRTDDSLACLPWGSPPGSRKCTLPEPGSVAAGTVAAGNQP